MNVLVTGGAGFMGSAVVRQLEADGHAIRVLDLLTYAGSWDNIEGTGAERVLGDVCDARAVERAVSDMDVIVHMAAETHVERSLSDAGPFIRTNVEGTRVVLEACRARRTDRVIHLIHVSTDEVFGSASSQGFREEDPHLPGNPYAVSKAAAEGLIRVWERCYGLQARVVRCVNNYGPRQHDEKAVAGWIRRAVAGEPLLVHGTGLAERDWLHVDDFARAIGRIVVHEGPRRVFHLAAQCHRTNLQMALQIAELAGGASVQCVTDRPGQDARYALDDAGTRADLGWAPQVPLDVGLGALIAEARKVADAR